MDPNKSIIIVDDDDVSNYLHSMIIKDSGFEGDIKTFTSGLDALDYLINNFENTGLIFLDLNMPKINGFEFLGKLEKMDNNKTIPVVVLTSLVYNANIQVPERYSNNIIDILEKPLSEDAVKGIITTLA